jgi:hypothetical protein
MPELVSRRPRPAGDYVAPRVAEPLVIDTRRDETYREGGRRAGVTAAVVAVVVLAIVAAILVVTHVVLTAENAPPGGPAPTSRTSVVAVSATSPAASSHDGTSSRRA